MILLHRAGILHFLNPSTFHSGSDNFMSTAYTQITDCLVAFRAVQWRERIDQADYTIRCISSVSACHESEALFHSLQGSTDEKYLKSLTVMLIKLAGQWLLMKGNTAIFCEAAKWWRWFWTSGGIRTHSTLVLRQSVQSRFQGSFSVILQHRGAQQHAVVIRKTWNVVRQVWRVGRRWVVTAALKPNIFFSDVDECILSYAVSAPVIIEKKTANSWEQPAAACTCATFAMS